MVEAPCVIRPAKAGDEALILRFVRELAEYEKLLHEVVATEQDFREQFFGPSPKIEALIAEVAGQPVGQCLFFHNFSTFLGRSGLYIEDIYVQPSCRGKGVGFALFREVVKLARERRCGRVEWAVLDWNRPAIDFYEKQGAKAKSEWTTFRLTEDAFDGVLNKDHA